MSSFVFLFSQIEQMLRSTSKDDFENLEKLRSLFGSKGLNLAKMILLGLSVPIGFTITTQACRFYYENNNKLSDEFLKEIYDSVKKLEEITQKKFKFNGINDNFDIAPLLVSVRSGARDSMPGMMDTILNLGMNDLSANSLLNFSKDKIFVNNTYFRFIQMFSNVVKGIPKTEFDNSFDINKCKNIYKNIAKEYFPEDVYEQLIMAIKSVFDSWNSPRAKFYRKINSIDDSLGTAVNVQMMVFGNYGENSGTGVVFSRNPINGERNLFGEYLVNAQGEDVVSGQCTPESIEFLKEKSLSVYLKLKEYSQILESEFNDIQDMEFTVENNNLYMLQTRNAKRSANASIKSAIDFFKENKITKEEAIKRISPEQIDRLMHLEFDDIDLKKNTTICNGLAASPGAAVGEVVFCTEEVIEKSLSGVKVILVKNETSPEDVEGMEASEGVLTSCGGMTSHAAVVARGMGKCCIVGCDKISIKKDFFIINNNDNKNSSIVIKKGDIISLDGSTGNVYFGKINTIDKKKSEEFDILMSWVDSIDSLKVFANADNASDVKLSIKLGAKGIGLCRTEHMFFKEERIKVMRKMIISKNDLQRKESLEELLFFQKKDFIDMFFEVGSLPITIRLLDPPLHEFLPDTLEGQIPIAKDFNISIEELKSIICDMHEVNPMMGHRGCRLFVSYPDIARIQTRAIIEAAIEAKSLYPKCSDLVPEIMIPLIGDEKELIFIKNIIIDTADSILSKSKNKNKINIKYKIGTMIEIPRAALIADKLAKHVDFFSFGTNDLTQMTFGFSRDDASKFLNKYYENNIYNMDPFVNIDINGVGNLMKTAVSLGKSTNKNLKIGVCGEHGGDPYSIKFFNHIGIDYVSCSAFRIPCAKFTAVKTKLELF